MAKAKKPGTYKRSAATKRKLSLAAKARKNHPDPIARLKPMELIETPLMPPASLTTVCNELTAAIDNLIARIKAQTMRIEGML